METTKCINVTRTKVGTVSFSVGPILKILLACTISGSDAKDQACCRAWELFIVTEAHCPLPHRIIPSNPVVVQESMLSLLPLSIITLMMSSWNAYIMGDTTLASTYKSLPVVQGTPDTL